MSAFAQAPFPGMQYWVDQHGKIVLRLHYSADPDKAAGELIHVPDLGPNGMDLTPWAFKEYSGMTNPALYMQEYEVDGSATSGAKIFQMWEEATLEDSFPIPPTWTRRMSLDPHPSVPHAFLWVATDPHGDRWYYRELWPSKSSFRYEGKQLLGQAGPCPEEDNRFSIRQYVQTIRYLESNENPQNRTSYDDNGQSFDERIHARVIDYSARAFAAETREGQRQLSFQQVYEMHMSGQCGPLGCNPACPIMPLAWFEDSKKDHQVGEELVNSGLRPFAIIASDGQTVRQSSHIHIFRDRCPELIYELKNARRQQLTPLQVDRMDPTGKPVEVRIHECDNTRYLEMANPIYIPPSTPRRDYRPPVEGIGY